MEVKCRHRHLLYAFFHPSIPPRPPHQTTSGRVLYSPDRLVKIGQEAAKTYSVFAIEDRIGLVDDAFALSKAGYSDVSAALALTDALRNESECQWTILDSPVHHD